MKLKLFATFLTAIPFTTSSLLAIASEAHRPFTQMSGGCESFQVSLKQEFLIWQGAALNLVAAQAEAEKPSNLPLGKLIRLSLREEDKMDFAVLPEKKFAQHEKSFAGLTTLHVDKDAEYRLSLGAKVWLDLIEEKTKKSIPAFQFEMQTGCDKIFKTVSFKLKSNTPYLVQISSSRQDSLKVLATQVE